MKLDITVIILTYNEELHIRRCLDRIASLVSEVVIVDCYSTDKTLEIASNYDNVTILQNKWVNYATQFNWALEHAKIKTKWILRLDADEYLTPDLIHELQTKLPSLDKKKRHPKAKLMNINLIMGLVEQTAISFKK